MKLRFLGMSRDASYQNNGRGISPWAPGEERDVSEENAAYLMETFEGCFEVIRPRAPVKAPANRAMDAPVTRAAPKAAKKAPAKKKATGRLKGG